MSHGNAYICTSGNRRRNQKKKSDVRMDNSFGARPKVEQGHGQRLPHEHWREYFGFFPFDLQSSFSPRINNS